MTEILYVFGAGGHGREVAWLARQAWGDATKVVFLVDDTRYLVGPVNGDPVRLLQSVTPHPGAMYVVAVGSATLREKAAEACSAAGMTPATLVHPRVERSQSVSIGEGSVVCAGTILTTNLAIGRHVHINVGCTVSHDVVLRDYVTLSPGVHVAGNVNIEQGCFVGIGASIVNGHPGQPLVIGQGATIAAGACVTGSVEAGALVAGVPATRRR